jgi:hypothetical protein
MERKLTGGQSGARMDDTGGGVLIPAGAFNIGMKGQPGVIQT